RDAADGSQVRIHGLGFHQQRIDSRDAHGTRAGAIQASHQLMIDASCQNFDHAVQHVRRRNTQAVHEPAFNSALGKKARHLLAAAMDYYDFVHARYSGDLPCQHIARFGSIEQCTAGLEEKLHSRPSVSARPSARFIFCTACPAAPFTRLSMALITTPRPPTGSNATPMSQKFVRATARASGMWPGLYSRINGSPR